MAQFAVESGVPLPPPRCWKYPFDQLKIGDSFLVPISEAAPSAVHQAAAVYRRRHPGTKFTCRTVGAEHGTRCWRIA